MADGQRQGVAQHIRRLVAAERAGALTDRELLDRFVGQRDEDAFAALVRRHGPLVLGVCRRVLRDAHDAEDACQAAFLVLARKAASVRDRDSLGSYLYGVAFRVAANLRREVARRRGREAPAVDVPARPAADVTWREVRDVLDQELRRLPERFRAPLLLCYLEGKTRDEAAQELGWTPGVLRGRLDRGREMLRARLARRGLTLSAALLATLLTGHAVEAALPVALALGIARGAVLVAAGQVPAAGAVTARAIGLMEGMVRAMTMTRIKTAVGLVLALGLLGIGAGTVTSRALTAQQPQGEAAAPAGGATAAPQATAGQPPAAAKPAQPGHGGELARAEAESRLNLKQIALAIINYCDAMGRLPEPAIYAGEKNPGAGDLPASGPGRMSAPGRGHPPIGGMGGFPGGGGMAGGTPTMPGGQPGMGGMPGMPGMGGSGASMMPPGMSGGMGGAGAGAGGKGKALLSWRVIILPYLGEQELYRQFKLDEPWDGPHNKNLLARMPKVYAPPGTTTAPPNTTFYQVFVGPHALFEKHQTLFFPASVTDGTSNTLLVVEGGSPVPWTKPEDLHFAPDEPLPELGGLFPGICNAAFCDGSVCALRKDADPDILRAAITRDGGEVVDLDRIKAPATRLESELRERNARLKEELRREQARLNELSHEKQLLEEETSETRRLREENARLEQALRQMHAEAARLAEEIRQAKQTPEKKPER